MPPKATPTLQFVKNGFKAIIKLKAGTRGLNLILIKDNLIKQNFQLLAK